MLANLASLRSLLRPGERPLPALWAGRLPTPLAIVLAFAAFIGPLLLTASIAQDTSAPVWGVLVADLVALFVFLLLTWQRPVLFFGLLVLWFALQRILVAVLAPDVSGDMVRWLLVYKEGFYVVLVAAGAFLLAARWLTGRRELTLVLAADLLALAFLATLAVAFLVSSADFTPRLTYLRRFAAPALLYLGARLLVQDRQQVMEALRLTMAVVVAVALFGLVERFLLGASFWQDGVDATAFYQRQIDAGLIPPGWLFVYRGLPDGIFIALPLEVPVRRLVSTFLEPTTLGAFLAFGLLLLLLAPPRGRWRPPARIAALLVALALVATLSRGGMLVVVAAVGFFGLVRLLESRQRFPWRDYLPLLPVLAVLGAGLVLTTFSFSQAPDVKDRLQDVLEMRAVSGFDNVRPVSAAPASDQPADPNAHPPGSTAAGAQRHLSGLTSGLDALRDDPLGSGLGTTGNWSETPGQGGESMIGALASQLGIFGFVFWLGFVLAAIAALVRASLLQRAAGALARADLLLLLAAALFGLMATSWVSESASGLLGNAAYFTFAGWAIAIETPLLKSLRFAWLPAAPASD